MGSAAGLGALAVLALVLASPPHGQAWLAWVALAPLIAAIRVCRGAADAALLGLGVGTAFQALYGGWLLSSGVHPAAFALGALASGSFVAIFAAVGRACCRAPWAGSTLLWPALWVVSEYARVHVGWGSAPWGLLGHSQVSETWTAGIAAVSGAWGLSFVLAASAALLCEAWNRPRPILPAALALAALLAVVGAGLAWSARAPRAAGELRVAVLQAGAYVAPREDGARARELFERYAALTRRAVAQGAELVVWPEASVPAVLPRDRLAVAALGGLAAEVHVPLVVAAGGRAKGSADPGEGYANSVLVIDAEGRIAGRYDKMRLLPFDEWLPWRGRFPWPDWISGAATDARPGTERTPLSAAGARFAVAICWENLFPGDVRRSLGADADFLVSTTNEAFTPTASGRRQLFAQNALRAAENGVPVVRAATTGISAIIGPDGAVAAAVEDAAGRREDVAGFAIASLALGLPRTPYRRHGDWLVALCAGVVAWGARAAWSTRGDPEGGRLSA